MIDGVEDVHAAELGIGAVPVPVTVLGFDRWRGLDAWPIRR